MRFRGRDTLLQRVVRSLLQKKGLRFWLHEKHFMGTPDIVRSKYPPVVLLQCCFGHRPREPRKLGWHGGIVWECEKKNLRPLKQSALPLLTHSSPSVGGRTEVIDDSHRSPRCR